MSNFADLEQGDSLVVGDGVAELLVTCAGRDRVSLVAERSIEIPDGTSLFVKGGRQARAGVRDLERESVNDLLSRWPASLLISFVESATAVSIARDTFPKAFEVVPKVETFHGVRNVGEIASVSDTIMLGRGDLALSVGLGRLGAAQEEVMREAHSAGSNVVIATGVLESLMGAEIPTRAEAIDLYNSYRQGAYGVALTSETAGARQDPIRVIRGARALMDDMEGKIAHSRAERHDPGPTL